MNKTIKLGINTYEFRSKSFDNYRNWGHTSTLYKNGEEVGFAKAIYLNRTWESYQYQSVMMSALYNYKDELLNKEKDNFKVCNDIKRLGGDKLDVFNEYFNDKYQELNDLKSKL